MASNKIHNSRFALRLQCLNIISQPSTLIMQSDTQNHHDKFIMSKYDDGSDVIIFHPKCHIEHLAYDALWHDIGRKN